MLRSNLGHTALAICMMVLTSSALAVADDTPDGMATIGPGVLQSVIPEEEGNDVVNVPMFVLDRRPVTNREFLEFVQANPEWRRDNAIRLFVDTGYLSHWTGASELGPDLSREQPVTQVSWFAATAYCEAKGASLPRWYEWELVPSADATRANARDDRAWRQEILNWYARMRFFARLRNTSALQLMSMKASVPRDRTWTTRYLKLKFARCNP
ncbi:MAG: formylglycine-generating enzyme family protein [Pseudomonadales bacterium]